MSAEIRYISHPHPVTGITNSKLGIWAFLASEVMLFGGLFCAYAVYRAEEDRADAAEQALAGALVVAA